MTVSINISSFDRVLLQLETLQTLILDQIYEDNSRKVLFVKFLKIFKVYLFTFFVTLKLSTFL